VVLPAFEGINTALQRQARHPMASHLIIHLTEGGTPGPATPATMQPGYAGEQRCSGQLGWCMQGFTVLAGVPEHVSMPDACNSARNMYRKDAVAVQVSRLHMAMCHPLAHSNC
jgi:hypothetical protein